MGFGDFMRGGTAPISSSSQTPKSASNKLSSPSPLRIGNVPIRPKTRSGDNELADFNASLRQNKIIHSNHSNNISSISTPDRSKSRELSFSNTIEEEDFGFGVTSDDQEEDEYTKAMV
jgi:hypothetical protein